MRISFREYLDYYLRGAYAGSFDGFSRPAPAIRDVLSALSGAIKAEGVHPSVQLAPSDDLQPRRYRHLHYRALFWYLSSQYSQFAIRDYAPPDLVESNNLYPASVGVEKMVPQEQGLSTFEISWRDVLIPPGGVQ